MNLQILPRHLVHKLLCKRFNTTSTTTQELLIGERLIGQTSGAVAIVAEKLDNSNISFIYKNEIAFVEGRNC